MKETFMSVASEGGGAHVIDVMNRIADPLARAIRRAVPFLGRRGVDVQLGTPKLTTTHQVMSELEGPIYDMRLVVEPGGGRARVGFDASSISFLLDGTLCGDGTKQKKLGIRLSPPQHAFIQKLGETVSTCLSDTLEREAGLSLKVMPTTLNDRGTSASLVALTMTLVKVTPDDDEEEEDDFSFGDDDDDDEEEEESPALGTIVVAISKTALLEARGKQAPRTSELDERVLGTMAEVPVDVVAELGRIKMSLASVFGLNVGDTLRMPVPVNGTVKVFVEDIAMFQGRPTTAGSQLAVRLVEPDAEATSPLAQPADPSARGAA